MKKSSGLMILVVSLAACTLLQSCQSTKSAASAKMLKFNFEKGKGYDYEMTTNLDQEIMGQKLKLDMTAYYSMNVDDDNGTEKSITTTFDRMKMNMDMGLIKVDVDSDNPVPTEGSSNEVDKALTKINSIFGSLRGKKFTMKIDLEGKVKEVSGFKEIGQSIVDSVGTEMSQGERDEMTREFEKQFNDNGMKGQFDRILYIFPNKEVKVGDSWQKTTELVTEMPAKYISTYTVKEIEGDMVTLDEKTKIETSDEKMEISGTVSGTHVVDSRIGLVVSADQEMKMKVTAMGMSFDMKGATRVKGKANQ